MAQPKSSNARVSPPSVLAELVTALFAVSVRSVSFRRNNDAANREDLPWRLDHSYAGCRSHVLGETREAAAEYLLASITMPEHEGPCCRICDGQGHGYPGGGPCPLEMQGEPLDPCEEEADRQYEEDMAMAQWRYERDVERNAERAILGGAW